MSEDLATVAPARKKMGLGKKILIGGAAFFALMIILGAVLGKSATSTNALTPSVTPTLTSAPVASPTPAATVAKKLGLAQDKSFRLESIKFTNDSGAGANARVTNISNTSKSAFLGISIFEPDGVTVATTLLDVVNDVAPGQTITATFMSAGDALPSGQFKYSFQVTTEY